VKHIQTFGKFWYDFIIGDDWRVALGVTAAIALLYVIARQGMNWWWMLPVAVAALLAVSLNNTTRPRRR
jgi:ABC-type phosphate transport system auxiliary subunit